MSNRKTHDQFLKETSHLPITILGKYTGGRQKLEIKCNDCGHEWSMRVDHIKSGKKCPKCSRKKVASKASKSHEQFSIEMNAKGLTPLSLYENRYTSVKMKCNSCGREWMVRPENVRGCKICALRKNAEGRKKIPDIVFNNGEWIEFNTKHGRCMIDVDDFYKYIDRSVHCDAQGYPRLRIGGNGIGLHKLIMPDDKMMVDHINRNPLDNRRRNLRYVTRSQNAMNAKCRCDSSTGIRGVSYNPKRKNWKASIHKDGKTYHLGVFDNIEIAIGVRNQAEIEMFGEYARNEVKTCLH
jgi:predicted Zn-ribbon and HTH transcriptional regulator